MIDPNLENKWLVVHQIDNYVYVLEAGDPNDKHPYFNMDIGESKIFDSREEAEKSHEAALLRYHVKAKVVPASEFVMTVYRVRLQQSTMATVMRLETSQSFKCKDYNCSEWETTDLTEARKMLNKAKTEMMLWHQEQIMRVGRLEFN